MADKPATGNRSRSNRNDYSAYDRALVKAAQDKTLVTFVLATGEMITDCEICSVDTYQIEVKHDSDSPMKGAYSVKREWFNKALIARTRIQ